jgi:hypothetical protein
MVLDISSERLVIRPWLAAAGLTLKMQSVLFSALRGCDTVGKEDASKPLVRAIRAAIMRDAEEQQRTPGFGSIFLNGDLADETVRKFTDDLDHYPVHFVMHLAHACEIIGYKHPDRAFREPFLRAYNAIVEALHLLPESVEHLDLRLADALYGDAERERYRSLTVRRTEIVWRVPGFRLLVARCIARLVAGSMDPTGFQPPPHQEETAAVRSIPRPPPSNTRRDIRHGGYRD